MPQSLSFRLLISRLSGRVGLGLLIALVTGSLSGLEAQDNPLNPSQGPDLDATTSGNTTQAARMAYHAGMRLLDQAIKAADMATGAETDKEREKLMKRSTASYKKASQQFVGALRQDADVFEAYESLGLAFRKLGKYQEALEIHAIALRRDEGSMENFSGWAESLMELNMLGNATQSYTAYVESKSPRAPILMAVMKKWLVAREADPGDLDPAHVERMAAWIAQQESGG